MNTWVKGAVVAVVGVALPIVALAQEKIARLEGQSVRVVRDVVTTDVVDHEPLNNGLAFSAFMGPVYYFTEVEGASASTHITHIWYYQGQQMAKITLSVRGSHWRTWSRRDNFEDLTGTWKVEAVDAKGNVLSSQSFLIE